MKNRRWMALVLAAALLLSCTGCSFLHGTSNKKELYLLRYHPEHPDDPPYYDEVMRNLGQDLETVISAMGLKPEDFENRYGDCYWYYKDPVEYLDYDFQMMLEYQEKEHIARVVSIRYALFCDEDPEKAADTLVELREKLEGYHAPDTYTTDKEVTLQEVTKEELVRIFTDPEGSAEMSQAWVSYDDLSEVPIDPLDPREFNCTSVEFAVSYPDPSGAIDGAAQRVSISLTYGLSYLEKNSEN